jgi:hypothetical protein
MYLAYILDKRIIGEVRHHGVDIVGVCGIKVAA